MSKAIRPEVSTAPRLSPPAESWVSRTLRQFSLEQKLGQVLMVGCFGSALPGSPEYQAAERAASQLQVGGFMITTQRVAEGIRLSEARATARLTGELQSRAPIPLIFGADLEHGAAMRLEGGTSFPHAMAVAAGGQPQDARVVGRITASEARAVGIHWIFAPVADLNSNPANPIINVRSFGEDPRRVAEFVAAFVRGAEENGTLACAKHFPGHGDTSVDSHLDLPLVTADREQLESTALVPFREAIAAGVSSVMTGHLAVRAVEPDANLPATLSRRVITDLLRAELGFHGLVITDALDMAAIAARFSPTEAAVRALEAGADVLLLPPNPEAIVAALREAVERGRLSTARVDEAVTRILRAKAKLGIEQSRQGATTSGDRRLGTEEFLAAAREMAGHGVTLLRDADELVPLDRGKSPRLLLLVVAGDRDAAPALALEGELRARSTTLRVIRCDTHFHPAASVELPSAESYDMAIVALLARVADRKGTVSLPAEQVRLVDSLLESGKPVIVAALGSPYVIERFPKATSWIAVFSTTDVAEAAVGRALFGEIPIQGRLPVAIPSTTPPVGAGDGLVRAITLRPASFPDQAWADASSLIEKGVAERAFPGGVLAVGLGGQLGMRAFGRHTYQADGPPVTPETIYDVASLTKPVVTTTLAAQQVEAGKLGFDTPVCDLLEEWATLSASDPRWHITVRHLLTHTSGLPAHVDYFHLTSSKAEIIERVLKEPLAWEPGRRSVYSDLDFLLLGEIIERVAGASLDELARTGIFEPLAMHHSLFRPPAELRKRIAPTEDDADYRRSLVHGEVHDENAFAMGGVAGHAGLFSTAGDLARFAQTMLNGGAYGARRILEPATVAEITAPQALAAGTRALGWVVPTENSSSGHYFSPRSFGHTGFTGASLWIDPDRNLFVVFLTNRIYPTRDNEKLSRLRPALHDALVKSLDLAGFDQGA